MTYYLQDPWKAHVLGMLEIYQRTSDEFLRDAVYEMAEIAAYVGGERVTKLDEMVREILAIPVDESPWGSLTFAEDDGDWYGVAVGIFDNAESALREVGLHAESIDGTWFVLSGPLEPEDEDVVISHRVGDWELECDRLREENERDDWHPNYWLEGERGGFDLIGWHNDNA